MIKIKNIVPTFVALTLLTSSCAAPLKVYQLSQKEMIENQIEPGHATQEQQEVYFYGAFNTSDATDLARHCPYDWYYFSISVPAWGNLLNLLTFGLYTPWEVELVCLSEDYRKNQKKSAAAVD